MGVFKNGDPKNSNWRVGAAFSLILHGIILFLALFSGFGSSEDLGGAPAPEGLIEGRLVSLSELEGLRGGNNPGDSVSNPPKEDIKREEPQEPVKISEPEKKIPPPKEKTEVQKVEEPKPKEKAVVLETEREKKKEKQTAKTELSPKPSETNPSDSAKSKQQVLEQMQKNVSDKQRQGIIDELRSRNVAEADSTESGNGGSQGGGGFAGGKSSGGASRGTIASLFVNRLSAEIRRRWEIPPNIPTDGSLRTVVVFKMDVQGNVYDIRVEEASRNPLFDDFCVRAIRKAAPLKTPVPAELLEEARNEGIQVSFRNTDF
ncbi:MAG: TonB C-terminal domain-containing protein [Deltaproteobacteria bacterium]